MNVKPPHRAERLIRWSLAPWERAAILGDLSEEFEQILGRSGSNAAARWYWWQVVRSIWPNLLRRVMGDEDRRRRAVVGGWNLAAGCIYLVWWLLSARNGLSAIIWLNSGALILLDSVVRKRPLRPWREPTVAELTLAAAGLAVVISVVAYGIRREAITETQVAALVVAGQFCLFFLPRRSHFDLQGFEVRHKLSADLEREALMTVSVPNEPLGLSRVILRRASVAKGPHEATSPLHTYDPIIGRRFTPSQQVRAFAVVNLPDPQSAPSAHVDLVDDAGVAVKRVVTPVIGGHLEQVGSWADFADKDPAEHFGQIDVTVPLTGLPDGAYRVRVRVEAGEGSSGQEEAFEVVGSRA